MKRGGYAEGKVRNWLTAYKHNVIGFTFNRLLDAHSSHGRTSVEQPGDYQWFLNTGIKFTLGSENIVRTWTRNGVIEVKEVAHAYRLPVQNFGIDQVGRMQIRALAGSEPLVLVCFRPPDEKPCWRTAPLEFFQERPSKAGSWDFREIDAYTHCDDLLHMFIGK